LKRNILSLFALATENTVFFFSQLASARSVHCLPLFLQAASTCPYSFLSFFPPLLILPHSVLPSPLSFSSSRPRHRPPPPPPHPPLGGGGWGVGVVWGWWGLGVWGVGGFLSEALPFPTARASFFDGFPLGIMASPSQRHDDKSSFCL